MNKQVEKFIFGKNQKQYDYLSYFFFILMTSIAVYKLLFQESMTFWAFTFLITIAYGAIYIVRFRYRRFIIFDESHIILKQFSRKNIKINCQQIIKFIIKQLYYSAEDIAQNLAVSGAATLAFVPQDVEKLAETEISIWCLKNTFKIKLNFLPISTINEINRLIAKKTKRNIVVMES